MLAQQPNAALDAAARLLHERMLGSGDPPRRGEIPCPTWSDPEDRWRYQSSLGLSNDNLPPFAIGLVPKGRRDPRAPKYADDDGRTFHASFDQTLTNDARGTQLALHSSYEMLTEDGAQEDPTKGRRADVMNNILSVNKRWDMSDGLTFYAGVGAGTQTVGDIGGLDIQTWFHEKGGMGGRLPGQGLQLDYGGLSGSVTRPALSGGAKLEAHTGSESGWNASAALEASVLVGTGKLGMSSAQAGLSGHVGHPKIASLDASVFASGGRANGPYLQFAPIADATLGFDLRMQVNALRLLKVPVMPYVMVQSNAGGFADTTYTIGFVVGLGKRSWIRPSR